MIKATVFKPHRPTKLYHVQIEPNQSIRISGDDDETRREPTPFDKTFKMGDWAEYDSYNMRYIGQIVGIGEKTVTIQERYSKQTHRLKLADFAWRNDDFDLEKVLEYNNEESKCI